MIVLQADFLKDQDIHQKDFHKEHQLNIIDKMIGFLKREEQIYQPDYKKKSIYSLVIIIDNSHKKKEKFNTNLKS